MAIAIALLEFNDLGCSMTPTFLFRNRFYLQLLSRHCPKMNKKSMWEVKEILRFLSMEHRILPSCDCKARETMVASHCGLLHWRSPMYSDLSVLPGMFSPKRSRWPPVFFTFLTSLIHHLSRVEFFRKKSMLKNFRGNVLKYRALLGSPLGSRSFAITL